MNIPKSIPPQFQEKYEEAASMIIPFCTNYLDKEYEELCIRALQKLCRKKSEPMSSGRINMWGAGIVYAITQNNGVSGNKTSSLTSDSRFHLDAASIASAFGVSKSGMAEKANIVKSQLGISPSNEEWFISSSRDSVQAMKMMRSMMSRKR